MVRICDSEQREPRNSPWLFSFSWEQRKLGEIVSPYSDPVPTPHDGYWRVGIRSHAKGTFQEYVPPGQELGSAKMHKVKENNLIVNITFAWEHAVAITTDHDANKLVSHRFPQFSFSSEMLPAFFKYVILDENFRQHLFLASPGGAGRNRVLKIPAMLEYFMVVPKKEEQKKINAFFRNLDYLITLHQCKYFYSSPKSGIFHNEKTNAWEQRQFEKTFSLLQNNTLSRAELSASAGVAANIHYGDVLIKFGEYLDMRKETFPWIEKQTDADKFRTSFLQDGDVVFADTAEDETVGKCCEIRNCGSMVIISGLHTIPCRPESKFASGYLGYYLNSTAFHEQLVPLMQGTKVVSISKAALKSTFVRYPSDDKEQQKIGTFFRKLDDLLALHQREYLLFEVLLC